MKTRKIEIHNEKQYSWCEIECNFYIYGKNEEEIRQAVGVLLNR